MYFVFSRLPFTQVCEKTAAYTMYICAYSWALARTHKTHYISNHTQHTTHTYIHTPYSCIYITTQTYRLDIHGHTDWGTDRETERVRGEHISHIHTNTQSFNISWHILSRFLYWQYIKFLFYSVKGNNKQRQNNGHLFLQVVPRYSKSAVKISVRSLERWASWFLF